MKNVTASKTSGKGQVKRSSKQTNKKESGKGKPKVMHTEKELDIITGKQEKEYFPAVPVSPVPFVPGLKAFASYPCFSSFSPASITACKTCNAKGFCKTAKEGKNIFGFNTVFSVSSPVKETREVKRTANDDFSLACALVSNNPGFKGKELAKLYFEGQTGNKSLSACSSLLSSIRCCMNAFSGKAEKDSAVYALAVVLSSGEKGKASIIKKAVSLCGKPESTVSANLAYMQRVFNYNEAEKAKLNK